MATYKELRKRALADPEVGAEYERLNREEFALLDEMLAARHRAGLSQAQVAERMGTKAPAVTRLERALASGQHSPSIGYVAPVCRRVWQEAGHLDRLNKSAAAPHPR